MPQKTKAEIAAEKAALKASNEAVMLENKIDRELKVKDPNPFDVKKLKSGGRVNFKGGGCTTKGMNKKTYGKNS